MEAFLEKVAKQLLDKHAGDMREVAVVFNNHRSGIFLQKHFAKLTQDSLYIPEIIGIDDLVARLGRRKIMPNEFLLFELYRIHEGMEHENRKFQKFEEFISFGEMLLADFSEIDQYCVDAKALFDNLYELKELGEWHIDEPNLSPMQKQYLAFYQSLYQYYQKLHTTLAGKNQAYHGMAYREVAEEIDTLIEEYLPKQIYFVGFNALSECEARIIRAYVRRGIGHMITDGDAYYYDIMGQHEAGQFLRKHKSQFDEIGGYPEHFKEGLKKIQIVDCAENVLQAKYVGQLLQDKQNGIPPEETAIVLADESLLVPMLNSLPANIERTNVTMGFPFTASEAHSLMLKLYSLYARAHGRLFYHQDILDIVSDHFVSQLLHAENIRSALTSTLKKNTVIRADWHSLEEIGGELGIEIGKIDFLFSTGTPSPDEFLDRARRLTMMLYDEKVANDNIKETEALACLLQIIDHFIDLQREYHFVDSLSTLQRVYSKLAQRRSIAFLGEPLSGLQILGVLETRNLDFRRVIMLSTNEGLLPSGRGNNTLIPYQLKVRFNIPTYQEKDAVYAYHFYRFLQCAEEVVLVYNSESDGMGKGEPSRFILQVKDELKKQYPDNIVIESLSVTANSHPSNTPRENVGKKTDAVMNRLEKIAHGKGFSPSALNNYRNCPMKFYYENVLKARQKDEVSDDLDQSEVGNCIHEILEETYQKDPEGKVSVATLKDQLSRVRDIVREKFDKMFRNGSPHEGRNLLLQSVAENQISSFLQSEIRLLESGHSIKISHVEFEMRHELEMDLNGKSCTAVISGKADRIDQFDGTTRIIDYKSGGVEDKDLKADSNGEMPDKLFQLMTYSWLWQQKAEPTQEFVAGIVPLRNIGGEFMPAVWNSQTSIDKEALSQFEAELKLLVGEIMNPTTDFVPNHKSKSCKYCPMSVLCH